MFLSNMAVDRPVLTTVIVLIVAIMGVVCYSRVGVELFPEVDMPYLTVTIAYPGAGPEEIETLVSKPIEDALGTVEGIRHLWSYSQEGISSVVIEFVQGTDLDVAASDARDRVSIAEGQLPEDSEEPVIMKFDIGGMPVMELAVKSSRSPRETYQIAKDEVKPDLSGVKGVASVELIGGREREIEVSLDQHKLAARRLSVLDVVNAVAASNIDVPAGHITGEAREHTVRFAGKLERVALLGEIDVETRGGRVKLRDLGTIRDGYKEVREDARLDGVSIVGLAVQRRADANTIAVVDAVRKRLAQMEKTLPPDVSVEVAMDDSDFIREAISDVKQNILVGILLTSVVLYLFLHNLRGTAIVTLAMPASIISTFILVYFAGYTINIMSMMGLALAVGVLVNNAILVLENIHRHLELGHDPSEAARLGTSQIALAVASTTVTNLVVFVPIALMQSIVGQLFRQFAMTVVFSTIFSLFISFTLTPMLASMWFRKLKKDRYSAPGGLNALYARLDGAMKLVSERYRVIVRGVLRHRGLTVASGFVIFLLAAVFLPGLIGAEFFPQTDEGRIKVTVETAVGSSLQVTDTIVRQVEDVVSRIPEKDKVFARVGNIQSMVGGGSQGVHLGEVIVQLVGLDERERSVHEIVTSLRPALARIPGARIIVAAQQQHGGGGESPIQIEIGGEDITTLNALAVQALEAVGQVPGAVEPDTDWRVGKPEVRLVPQRARTSLYGLTVRDVALMLRAALTGEVAATFREGGEEYDIRVRLGEGDRDSIERISDLSIVTPAGAVVPVLELAEMSLDEGPTLIKRKDRQRAVTVSARIEGRSVGEVNTDIAALLDKITLPEGYSFYSGGEIEMMRENFADLGFALLLAVVLTFLSLAGILESFRYSFMTLLVLPISLVGALLGLLITANTINIMTLMAAIMLVGLVVNNAIIIIDYANVLRRQGKPVDEAIVDACGTRLRAILIANSTTVIAWIPLALGFGWGGEFRAPMAIVSIGGLMAGGGLALIIIPAIYSLFTRHEQQELQA